MLMNHLGVDGRGRVVFDAGDAVVGGAEEEDDEDDEDVEDALEGGEKRKRAKWAEGEGDVSLERLRRGWLCNGLGKTMGTVMLGFRSGVGRQSGIFVVLED